jgi:Coenzyme PQQ synthesis protein D (PqqD)
MSASERPLRKNPKVVFQAHAGEAGGVLLSLESAQYHGVNDVGWFIWELVDGERTVTEIAEAVRREFADAPPGLEDEVAAFLESLRARDLVSE